MTRPSPDALKAALVRLKSGIDNCNDDALEAFDEIEAALTSCDDGNLLPELPEGVDLTLEFIRDREGEENWWCCACTKNENPTAYGPTPRAAALAAIAKITLANSSNNI